MTLICCLQQLWANSSRVIILSMHGPLVMIEAAMYWDPDSLVVSKCSCIYGFVSFSFASHVSSG